jgi:hypothetical protein
MRNPGRERWLDIPDYEGRYQVSTDGYVRSLARVDDGGNRRSLRQLGFTVRPNARRYFNLCKRGEARFFCVSVLLAQAYGIANPRRCEYVIHRNRDNRDFRRKNLAWATLAEQRMNDGHKVSCRYYGVTCKRKSRGVLKWVAVVRINRRRRELGYFATPEQAAYAYDRDVKRLGLERPLNGIARPAAYQLKIKSLPGEIWRAFPGARGTHMISNKGRVRTLDYITSHGQRVLPKLRKITVDARGCRTIVIKRRRYGIETVMARVFQVGTPRRCRGL